MFQKIIAWMAIRGVASVAGITIYIAGALQGWWFIRPLQQFADTVEDMFIDQMPNQYQALAGTVGIGHGLPIATFVIGTLLITVTTIECCKWCGKKVRHPQKEPPVR